jgi:septal ring factor EnvC (AmiA/AmiB activator)
MAARPELGRLTANIRFLEVRLAALETRFAGLDAEYSRYASARQAAEDALAARTGRLTAVLPGLWIASTRLRGVLEDPAAPWAEADRSLEWLSAVYAHARAELDLREKQSAGALEVSPAEKALAPQTREAAARLEETREALLAERIKLWRELSPLRPARTPAERLEELAALAAASGIDPQSARERPIASVEGRLPWPVKGKRVSGFAPDASPPQNGVYLAAPAGAPVTAVHWGRVAYAGEARGAGFVAVVCHGGGAVGVYANLSRLFVKAGQEVARGEEIGGVGQLKPDGLSGMYFELRFGLKPSNPTRWLTAG